MGAELGEQAMTERGALLRRILCKFDRICFFSSGEAKMYFETGAEDVILAEIQGDVFEKSCRLGLESEAFIREYMTSGTAPLMDLPHHKIRWCGQAHLLACFLDEKNLPQGRVWNEDLMFWIGYTYRFWHSLTGQTSREIYKIADASVMRANFPKMHMDNVVAAVNGLLNR